MKSETEAACVWLCREDEWGQTQTQTQTEEAAITEEDLEIIKERETNIKQLEVPA